MSSIDKFRAAGGMEEESAIERLRFFCSIAMSDEDWIECEGFFDDLATELQSKQHCIEDK